jgi:hypothetical protein
VDKCRGVLCCFVGWVLDRRGGLLRRVQAFTGCQGGWQANNVATTVQQLVTHLLQSYAAVCHAECPCTPLTSIHMCMRAFQSLRRHARYMHGLLIRSKLLLLMRSHNAADSGRDALVATFKLDLERQVIGITRGLA